MSPLLHPCSCRAGTREPKRPLLWEDGECGLHLTKWGFLLLGLAAGIKLVFLLETGRPSTEFTTKLYPKRMGLAHRDFLPSWL